MGETVTTLTTNTITIQCSVKSEYDLPAVITWLKDGKAIKPGTEYVIEKNAIGSSLTILNSDEDDSGRFTCNATNIAGSTLATADVLVTGMRTDEIQQSVL